MNIVYIAGFTGPEFVQKYCKGIEKSFSFIKGIQIEMSLSQLYEGGILYKEMIEFIEKKGFKLYSIENGFSNPETGELLQMDGIFFRK